MQYNEQKNKDYGKYKNLIFYEYKNDYNIYKIILIMHDIVCNKRKIFVTYPTFLFTPKHILSVPCEIFSANIDITSMKYFSPRKLQLSREKNQLSGTVILQEMEMFSPRKLASKYMEAIYSSYLLNIQLQIIFMTNMYPGKEKENNAFEL